MADTNGLEEQVRILWDIEDIRKLKAKYFRCVDRNLWGEMEEVFTGDATADYGPDIKLDGRKAIIDFLKKTVGQDAFTTAHHGHNAEIEITGEATARATWALQDRLIIRGISTLTGWGYYQEEYVKENGSWRIKSTAISRLLEEWTQTK
jgi:hypothetical protein